MSIEDFMRLNFDVLMRAGFEMALLNIIQQQAAHDADMARFRERHERSQREYEILVLEHQWQLPEGDERC